MVECRTRDPEVLGSNPIVAKEKISHRDPDFLGSNPGVAKKKISHRSNQNNTSTNPFAPVLNT